MADYELATTRYERVASTLVAALLLALFAVTLLFMAWGSQQIPAPIRNVHVVKWSGHGAPVEGLEHDPTPPQTNELPHAPEPDLAKSLAAITDVAGNVAQRYDGLSSRSGGKTNSAGDRRQKGDGVGGRPGDIVPPWNRWEIQFKVSSLAEYRRQLDFFQIELAAFGNGDTIDYAFGLTEPKPRRRSHADPASESRLRFSWNNSVLRGYDQQLLAAADIPTRDRVLCQFISDELRSKLSQLEQERLAATGHDLRQCLRTVFAIERHQTQSGRFQIRVMSQTTR